MLGIGLTVMEQAPLELGFVLLLTGLAGRRLLTSFAKMALTGNVCGLVGDPTIFPSLVLVVSVGVIGYFLAAILGGGFVHSAEYGTYAESWENQSVSVRSVVENGLQHWKPMAWTVLLTTLVTWGPLIVTAIPLILLLLSACSSPLLGAVGFAALIFPLEIAYFASLIISIFTLYAYPAVVIDQVSGWAAIRRSFHVTSHNFGVTMTYIVVRGAFQLILLLILVPLGSAVHVPLTSLLTVIITLLLLPVLHLTKTMLYHYARPDVAEMELEIPSPIISDLYRKLPRATWSSVKRGLREIGGYLARPGNIPYHLGSIGAFALGVVLGNYVTNNGLYAALSQLGLLHPGQGNPNVDISRVIPPFLGIDIFFHNWLVSIGTALAGVGFGFPSFVDILFNGFILGVLQPTIPSNALFYSAILPHGVIELPSLILAGSVGLKLGAGILRVRLNPTEENRLALSKGLRQAVYIVVGLALLFLIAGLIEGILTPIIMRMYGWTF